MWSTVPQDKNEQKQCIEAFENIGLKPEQAADFRKQLEELADVYNEKQLFHAESVYEKLYALCSMMGLTGGKSKEELFGTEHSPESFKKDFLETWKNLSYKALKKDAPLPSADERDKFLDSQEQLHTENKKNAAAEQDKELEELRARVRELFDHPAKDENYEKYVELKEQNETRLNNSIREVEKRLAYENDYVQSNTEDFYDDINRAYDSVSKAMSKKFYMEQAENHGHEILDRSRKLFDDFTNKIKEDPWLAKYDQQLKDQTDRFFNAITEYGEYHLPDLGQEAKDEYVQKWREYKQALKISSRGLEQERKNLKADEAQLDTKRKKLQEREIWMINDRKRVDQLSKKDLLFLLDAKKRHDQHVRKLNADALAVSQARKESLDRIDPVMQEVDRIRNRFLERQENTKLAYTEEQVETERQRLLQGNKVLQDLNEEYAVHLQNLTQRYEKIAATRQSLEEVFEAADDFRYKKNFLGIQKKSPKIFTETMDAVESYINDRTNSWKAERAYDACRTYVESYMKSDRSGLKSGNKDGNTRRQAVVRMLELMDQLPEFQRLVVQNEKDKQDWVVIEDKADAEKDPNWVVVDSKEDAKKYTKLNYKQLEASLAKHAEPSKKKSGKNPKKQQKPEKKAFSNIDKLIEKNRGRDM